MGILQYFAYQHLPPHLQAVSKPVGDLAEEMNMRLPEGAEKAAGLRKLLEAKDCFVRANLPQPVATAPGEQPPVAEDPRM